MTTFNSMIVFDFANRVTNYDRDSKIVAIEKDLIDKGFVYPTEWDTLYPIQQWAINHGRYANMGWQQQLDLYNLTMSEYLSGKSLCKRIQKQLWKLFPNLMKSTGWCYHWGWMNFFNKTLNWNLNTPFTDTSIDDAIYDALSMDSKIGLQELINQLPIELYVKPNTINVLKNCGIQF